MTTTRDSRQNPTTIFAKEVHVTIVGIVAQSLAMSWLLLGSQSAPGISFITLEQTGLLIKDPCGLDSVSFLGWQGATPSHRC
jgi:hypothetical protein